MLPFCPDVPIYHLHFTWISMMLDLCPENETSGIHYQKKNHWMECWSLVHFTEIKLLLVKYLIWIPILLGFVIFWHLF